MLFLTPRIGPHTRDLLDRSRFGVPFAGLDAALDLIQKRERDCGLVVARVLEVRDDGGDVLVRLGMNARDVALEEHGVLMDPVLFSGNDFHSEPTGVYLLGNLCLESDLVTRRKVFLPSRPRAGDLLAFVNAAGYFMDLTATTALHQPLGRKVAAFRTGGSWQWGLDEQYWPIHPPLEPP